MAKSKKYRTRKDNKNRRRNKKTKTYKKRKYRKKNIQRGGMFKSTMGNLFHGSKPSGGSDGGNVPPTSTSLQSKVTGQLNGVKLRELERNLRQIGEESRGRYEDFQHLCDFLFVPDEINVDKYYTEAKSGKNGQETKKVQKRINDLNNFILENLPGIERVDEGYWSRKDEKYTEVYIRGKDTDGTYIAYVTEGEEYTRFTEEEWRTIKSMSEKIVDPDRIRDLETIQKSGQGKTMKRLKSFISHKDLYL